MSRRSWPQPRICEVRHRHEFHHRSPAPSLDDDALRSWAHLAINVGLGDQARKIGKKRCVTKG